MVLRKHYIKYNIQFLNFINLKINKMEHYDLERMRADLDLMHSELSKNYDGELL